MKVKYSDILKWTIELLINRILDDGGIENEVFGSCNFV